VDDQQTPIKATTWTADDCKEISRAGGAEQAEQLRQAWQRHEVALFRTSTARMVVEAVKDQQGLALVVCAVAGTNCAPLIGWLCDLAKEKGIGRVTANARTASRARLYMRWGRHFERQGRICRAAAAVVKINPALQTFARITFSTTPGAERLPT
jgi:hypothetical protein